MNLMNKLYLSLVKVRPIAIVRKCPSRILRSPLHSNSFLSPLFLTLISTQVMSVPLLHALSIVNDWRYRSLVFIVQMLLVLVTKISPKTEHETWIASYRLKVSHSALPHILSVVLFYCVACKLSVLFFRIDWTLCRFFELLRVSTAMKDNRYGKQLSAA